MMVFSLGILGISWFLPINHLLVSQPFACPYELQPLVDKMLQDLPSYANRVIQRNNNSSGKISDKFYILVAGKPDYNPLPLSMQQYFTKPDEQARQVFFTTIERHYDKNVVKISQSYYWLFLANSEDQWAMVQIYSQLGSTLPNLSPTPPQEISNGIMGQAVSLWLRDCRAGSLKIH